MKIGLSKKVISVILAVLMVFTAMPMTVFAGSSIDGVNDESAVALKEAITAYENKMDGNTVYNKMYDAYTAYLAANEAYDAYVYGDATIDLTTYTNNLTAATTAMTEFTGNKGTGTAKIGSSTVPSTAYSNLLYADGSAATDYSVGGESLYTSGAFKYGCYGYIYYPETTLLYDGTTTSMPVVSAYINAGGRYTCRPKYMYTTTSGFELRNYWSGYTDGFTWNTSTTYQLGYSDSTATGEVTMENTSNKRSFSNTMYYTGTPTTTLTTIESTNWNYYAVTYRTSIPKSTDVPCSVVSLNLPTTIRIINYKSLLDALTNNKSKLKLASSYTEGGAAALLQTFQTATDLDPNSFFTDSNNYTGLVDAIDSYVTDVGNATKTADVVTDSNGNDYGYAALRKAIDNKRATYNSTESDKYTNWDGFVEVYEAARDIMADLLATGYNDAAAAQAAADALNSYVLEVNFTPADTTELIKVIDDATVAVANKIYFTTETYDAANLEANISQAKIDVWGSEDAYKDAASTTGSENQSVVDGWETTIGEGVLSLVINKDAIVPSAKDYSMNSAIAYAQTFNSADYANYSTVTEAIANCNNFITSITIRQPGAVAAKIAEYRELVEALVSAIINLQPAFSKLSNGTVVSAGSTATTTLTYSRADTWTLTWERPSDQVFFRTTHDAATFDIGTSNFTWYSSRDYDQYLETLNFAALSTLTTGELSANGNYDGTVSDYDGALGASSANGGNYAWSNFVVTGFTGANGNSYTGKDLNGTGYLLEDYYDYSNDLLKAQNDYTAPCGGIVTHKGSTYFTADGTISLAKTSSTTPSLATSSLPTATTYTIEPTLGSFIYYKYQPFAVYAGFGYMANTYTQSATVIDISYMIDLINICDGLNYLDYTASSWSDLEAALAAAKADMDYGNMTADEIVNGIDGVEIGCLARYTNLYNAWKALEAPLSNQVIKDAITSTMDTYNASNKAGTYSADSWAAFESAYAAAYNSVFASNGIYSDINIRAVDATDENTAAIAKVAQDLLDAFNALVKLADFSNLIAAAGTAIDSYVYTVTDLQAVADVINSSTYLQYTAEQKAQTYEDEQSAIDAQTNAILAKINALVTKEPIDTTALQAAKDKISVNAEDPDAWDGIAEAKDYIDSIADEENLYSPVTVYNATVYGINYTQDDTDTVVKQALTMLTPQYYTVTVIDQDGNTKSESYLYGSAVSITSISGENVDWYYSYKSNTAENSEKYYTTDKLIKFVVKGDTTLRTTQASDTTGTVKVTYVSSIGNENNKIIAIDYVAPGTTVTELPAQPTVPYYTATGYTLDGAPFTTSTAITNNITVVANYEADTDLPLYTITWGYLENDGADYNEFVETYEYNDEVTLTTNDAIYWVQYYSEDAYNSWLNLDQDAADLEYIVFYGNTYTFRVHEDAFIVALSEGDYDYDANISDQYHTYSYVADTLDENGCDVRVADDLVYADDKVSIIGTYTMPDNCTLVEAGILFAKGEGYDLTFKNVDNSTIYRLKSSQHTKGNQFVINIMSANIANGQRMQYASYLIYKDANGETHYIVSNPVTVSYNA